MPPALSLVSDAPIDHVKACREHFAKALEHAKHADHESRSSLQSGAEHFAAMAELPTLHPGIRERYRQASDAMNAAVQGIAAISSRGGM